MGGPDQNLEIRYSCLGCQRKILIYRRKNNNSFKWWWNSTFTWINTWITRITRKPKYQAITRITWAIPDSYKFFQHYPRILVQWYMDIYKWRLWSPAYSKWQTRVIASLYWHKQNVSSISLIEMAYWTLGEPQITNIKLKRDSSLHASAVKKGIPFYFNIGDLDFTTVLLSHFYQWNAWHFFGC